MEKRSFLNSLWVDCLVLGAVALFAIKGASGMNDFGESLLSSGLFPAIAGGLLLFLVLCLAVQAWRAKPQRGHGSGLNHGRVLAVFLFSLFYVWMLPKVHFLAGTVVYTAAFLWFNGEKRWWMIALVACGMTAVIQLVFGTMLAVLLP